MELARAYTELANHPLKVQTRIRWISQQSTFIPLHPPPLGELDQPPPLEEKSGESQVNVYAADPPTIGLTTVR